MTSYDVRPHPPRWFLYAIEQRIPPQPGMVVVHYAFLERITPTQWRDSSCESSAKEVLWGEIKQCRELWEPLDTPPQPCHCAYCMTLWFNIQRGLPLRKAPLHSDTGPSPGMRPAVKPCTACAGRVKLPSKIRADSREAAIRDRLDVSPWHSSDACAATDTCCRIVSHRYLLFEASS